MNKLSTEKRVQILHLLVEGSSMRATSRIAGVSINTVTKLLVDAGEWCHKLHNDIVKNLECTDIQCDEIWSFCYSKQRNKKQKMPDGVGDIWTWTALDTDSRMVISWHVGRRFQEDANIFMVDIASRLTNRVQMSSDGLRAYYDAVEEAFGCDIDFAMLVKCFSTTPTDSRQQFIGSKKKVVEGTPDETKISTSLVERNNLTMRTNIKRYARRTNAFSKKIENHCHAVSLHFFYYNFCRIHQTLKITPAMEAGVTDVMWDLKDIVEGMENEKD